jgi:hypothetical protein
MYYVQRRGMHTGKRTLMKMGDNIKMDLKEICAVAWNGLVWVRIGTK